jgi:hypothetical protein
MQSTGLWSLNHDLTTSLGLSHTPNFPKILSCFLLGNLPGNYRILPKTSDLGQSWGKVHDCGKITAFTCLPYLTVPYRSTKIFVSYNRKSTEQQRYLQRNDTNDTDTIVCGKITAVSALWRRAAQQRRQWR